MMRYPIVFAAAMIVAVASTLLFVSAARADTVSGASPGPAASSSVGQTIYAAKCAACHQASGKGGGGGMFPALANAARVNAADPTAMLTTIVHGKGAMPAWKGKLSAADIAAVSTYIRSAWGNKGDPVTESMVTAIK